MKGIAYRNRNAGKLDANGKSSTKYRIIQYVNKYTKTSRYDARNYDLVINADGKTEDEIVDLILQYINNTSK